VLGNEGEAGKYRPGLALTVSGDMSILPPLLKLSRHSKRTFSRKFCRGSELARKQEPFTHVDWTPPIPVLDADIAGQRVPEIESQVAESRR
jgi:hypothetical protein